MSTATLQHARTSGTARTLRDVRRRIKETPAPRWGEDAADHTRFLGYVAASMLVWTGVGIGGAALISEALQALGRAVG